MGHDNDNASCHVFLMTIYISFSLSSSFGSRQFYPHISMITNDFTMAL